MTVDQMHPQQPGPMPEQGAGPFGTLPMPPQAPQGQSPLPPQESLPKPTTTMSLDNPMFAARQDRFVLSRRSLLIVGYVLGILAGLALIAYAVLDWNNIIEAAQDSRSRRSRAVADFVPIIYIAVGAGFALFCGEGLLCRTQLWKLRSSGRALARRTSRVASADPNAEGRAILAAYLAGAPLGWQEHRKGKAKAHLLIRTYRSDEDSTAIVTMVDVSNGAKPIGMVELTGPAYDAFAQHSRVSSRKITMPIGLPA